MAKRSSTASWDTLNLLGIIDYHPAPDYSGFRRELEKLEEEFNIQEVPDTQPTDSDED